MKNFFTFLLVVMALALVIGVFFSFGKRDDIDDPDTKVPGVSDDVTTPDTNEPEGEEPDNVDSEAMGYTLSFKEDFFEKLNSLSFAGDDDYTGKVVMYVDGKKVDTMPEGGSMKALFVEIVCEGYSGASAELEMDVSNEENISFYSASSSGYWPDFYTPVALVLHGDAVFEDIRFFEP